MNEEKQVKKQLLKNMLLNLITFSIIFYILGLAIYTQFNNSLYLSADTELQSSQDVNMDLKNKTKLELNDKIENNFKTPPKGIDENDKQKRNPRIITILRDSKGIILENNETNNNLDDIFETAVFNKSSIGEIYEVQIEGYSYRGINYQNNDGTYKQVLINVDAEKTILKSFLNNLIISFGIALLSILVASYVLSKQTLKPIIEAWKKQTQFVQDASHELRTPLSIIKVKQENLLDKPESKIIDNVEDISITLEETTRLTKLIKELMELAKSDSNELKLNKEQIDFNKEMKSLIEMYKDVAQTEGKTLNMDLQYEEPIYADSNKLKELIVILLDNAIKYTTKGNKIDVRTFKKDNKFILEVEDTGIGISKEAIDHVFERFYREEKSRNRQKGGMGLGLSIAYNIVNAHKGNIKFEKDRKSGTKVVVSIPKNK